MPHSAATAPAPPEDRVLPSLFGDTSNPYQVRPYNFAYSLLAHAAALALLLYLGTVTVRVVNNPHGPIISLLAPDLTLPPAATKAGGGGGGGARELTPASKGTPPKPSLEQIAPPTVHVVQSPKLAIDPTVIVPRVALPSSNTIGDLKGILGPASDGTGSGSGVGNGSGGGAGSGNGRGVGPGSIAGIGGGIYHIGGGVSRPELVSKTDPEFSDEARKAKYQGTVTLNVVVGPDGRVHDARVVIPLGMGLDEKAIESVKHWTFQPAKKDGHPVAVYAQIQVDFRLY